MIIRRRRKRRDDDDGDDDFLMIFNKRRVYGILKFFVLYLLEYLCNCLEFYM